MSKLFGKTSFTPSARLFSNPKGKIDLRRTIAFDEHRSGWAYCMNAISGLHRDNGVLFDDFVEMRFSWELEESKRSGLVPYRRPWIGVLHNPPGMPAWLEAQDSPQVILELPQMAESMEHCCGFYVLSDYLRRWLAARVPVPVVALVHPTEIPPRQFSFERYVANPRRKVIQIGYWLRRLGSLARLDIEGFTKVWLVTNRNATAYLQKEQSDDIEAGGAPDHGPVERWDWVSNDTYDRLLGENLVFVHLYDSSANNTIVECIVRHTPILVNPLPAVVEYLGAEYPLYFETLAEAASKACSPALVRNAHEYLRGLDKTRFSGEFFKRSIEDSEIYRALPVPAPRLVIPGRAAVSPRAAAPSFDLVMREVREQLDTEENTAAPDATIDCVPKTIRQGTAGRRRKPCIAVVSVLSSIGETGGVERLYEGLHCALDNRGVNTEVVGLAAQESDFGAIRRSYLAFYDVDLSRFDGVISTKAPSYAVRHRNHVCYLPHTMRQFYDMFDARPAAPGRLAERELIHRIDRTALHRPSVRGVFTVGVEVRDRLRKYIGVDSEVLHHPTTLATRDDGEFRYLFLPGRLHAWKRGDLVLEALRHMQRDVELVVSGEGAEADRLRALARDLPRARFVGRVSEAELSELYAHCLAVLSCSVREDYGLTTIEGFLSGKPVVTCSDSGETARLVRDGVNGFVCRPDAQSIARRLDYLAADPGRARKMGRSGRETAEAMSWRGVCDALLGALDLANVAA